MKYLTVTDVKEWRSTEFEISDEECQSFLSARRVLSEHLEIEATYDALIEEYWQYKNSVDYWRLRSVSRSPDYRSNYEIRNRLNRITINILNLSKIYLDKHFHELSGKCYAYDATKNVQNRDRILEQREKIYQGNLNYVIGCKLRNKAQHHSLPVSIIVTGIKNRQGQKSQITFVIKLEKSYLIETGVPRQRLIKDDDINLTDVLDGYVFAISEMHHLNRSIVSESIEDQKKIILNVTEPRSISTGYSEFFTEIEVEDDTVITSDLDWFQVVEHLYEKHRRPIDYQRYMFGEHWPEQE